MKDLITAILAMVLVLGGWLMFMNYAKSESQDFIQNIRDDILPAMESGNWDTGRAELKQFSQDWKKFRRSALYFLDNQVIAEIDTDLAKTIKYAAADDTSNSAGELNAIIEHLSFLTEHQKLTLQNVF